MSSPLLSEAHSFDRPVSTPEPRLKPAGGHSRFPPSSSSRWSQCTASIGYIEEMKDQIPKQDWSFAERGTRAHDIGATLIKDPKAAVVADDAEMLATSSAYAEFVRSLIEPGDRVLIETKVRLFYHPSEKGTTDAALINSRRIYIADYKDGVGVSVVAKENTQLAIYAESLIQELELVEEISDSTLVTLAIYQPRDRADTNPVRLWVINRGELREFTKPIAAAKARIEKGDVEFKAGSHCDKSFCPVRGLCKHYGALGLTALSDDPVDDIIASPRTLTQLVKPETINRNQRQRILAAKPLLIKWLEEIENQEVHELMNGAAPDRFKLVEGKTNRQWSDPKAAEKLLGTLLAPAVIKPPVEPELVSPVQAEKALKGTTVTEEFRNQLKALWSKPPGRPTLVPVGDSRPALMFNPTEGLSKIETDASALI